MTSEAQCIWRLSAVKNRTGLSRSAIYEGVARGTFPPPIRLGRRSVGWLSDEVQNWIAERVAATRTTPSDSAR